MKGFALIAASTLASLAIVGVGGCTSEHRMDVAASQDDTRRSEFEHCRAEGRTDCDAILNSPVTPNSSASRSIREQERHEAYKRCVDRGGTDCDDLLHRDNP